jgi:hypothetical protein
MFGGCNISVTFKPLSAGVHTGELKIANGVSSVTLIRLIGIGVPGLSGRVMGGVQPVSGSRVAMGGGHERLWRGC